MASNPENPSNTTKMSYQDVQLFIRETDQIRSQLNFLNQQSDIISHSILDLEGSLNSLKEIRTREVGEKVLLPLGSYILIEAKIHTKDEVLFDIGSNILQNMNFESAEKKIEEKLQDLNKTKTMLTQQISQMQSMLTSRENFLNQLVPIQGKNK